MNKYNVLLFALSICLLLSASSCKSTAVQSAPVTQENIAPNPERFADQIEQIKAIKFDEERDRIVFTGSSSIRGWREIQSYYPDHQIINTGFGGSQMSDLLHYLEETVLNFAPSKVFIYEGDNDIAAKQPLEVIMANTEKVVDEIEKKFPDTHIILISPKPSLARWHLKDQYEVLNQRFQSFADKKANLSFANVWDVMLNEKGEVISSIFIQDGLHMNKSGYDLWDKVIGPLVEGK